MIFRWSTRVVGNQWVIMKERLCHKWISMSGRIIMESTLTHQTQQPKRTSFPSMDSPFQRRLSYPSQVHLQPCQWHPQPLGTCCQWGQVPPPLWCSLSLPSYPSGMLQPGDQSRSFLRQQHSRQNCLGCQVQRLQGLWGRLAWRQGLHQDCCAGHVDLQPLLLRHSTQMLQPPPSSTIFTIVPAVYTCWTWYHSPSN